MLQIRNYVIKLLFQNLDGSFDVAPELTSSANVLEHLFTELLNNEVRYNSSLYPLDARLAACYNCGNVHSIICPFPTYYQRCHRCLVISLDGSGHTAPCAQINTISGTRADIFAKKSVPLLKLRLSKQDASLHFLNTDIGQFEEMTNGQQLICSATDGYISMSEANDYRYISYNAASFKRMSFIVAVLDRNGYWRLRFRAVVTQTHGLLLFKLRSTLQKENGGFILPNEYRLNTVIILGLKPSANSLTMAFRIFANSNGLIDQRDFNGYTANASWTAGVGGRRDVLDIDDAIDAETSKQTRYFDKRIHEEAPPSLVSFHSQRFDQSHSNQ